ncbi:hypothetical protein [Brevundimonas sp.]|uniref:hypothetical protein n=1 Tax=Brevundimonas sp. TaxID=1871086 RepID=UPI003D108ACE
MSRILILGLTVLVLGACKPVAQPAAPAEPAAPGAPVAALSTEDATWTVLQDRYDPMETAPADPLAALEWRSVMCDHFAGEFGGDNSERDRQVNARMDELRCGDELTAELRALRGTRAGDPDAVARLDVLLARLG